MRTRELLRRAVRPAADDVHTRTTGEHCKETSHAYDTVWPSNAPAKLGASQIRARAQRAQHPKIARPLQRSLDSRDRGTWSAQHPKRQVGSSDEDERRRVQPREVSAYSNGESNVCEPIEHATAEREE